MRLTQATSSIYTYKYNATERVHATFLGDPTLRFNVVAPPTIGTPTSSGSSVTVNWSHSAEFPGGTGMASGEGYNVYRSLNKTGGFKKINGSVVTAASYVDSNAPKGKWYYMVRTVKLTSTTEGHYFNLSQGVFTEIDMLSAGNYWNLTILTPESGIEHTHGFAINNNATYDVVGTYTDYPTARARRWYNGTTTSLSAGIWSSSDVSYAFGVNDGRELVGVVDKWDYYSGYSHTIRAIRWPSGSSAVTLATLSGASEAFAINKNGIIVGYSKNSSGYERAGRWDPTASYAIEDLGILAAVNDNTKRSLAYGINRAGFIVGRSQKEISTANWQYRGFVCYPDSEIDDDNIDIGVLSGGNVSHAYAINDCNEVAGSSTSGGTSHTAVIKRPGDSSPQSLGTVSGTTYSYGYAVNNSGVVAGQSGSYAMIARVGMTAQDLNNFRSSGAGLTLVTAEGINDNLVIVGSGTDGSGNYRAFVLYP